MRWAGHVALGGGGEEFLTGFLVGNPVGKGLLGRTWSRWKDNIEMHF